MRTYYYDFGKIFSLSESVHKIFRFSFQFKFLYSSFVIPTLMSVAKVIPEEFNSTPASMVPGARVAQAQAQASNATSSKGSALDQRQNLLSKGDKRLQKKINTKKKVNEVYVPPPLSPYLILIISLLYMVAADGVIREDEISLLQTITGADKVIINVALKYTQKIKLGDFLTIAPTLLNSKERICILLNILDLMLIDGNTAEEELNYFFNIQEVFGFTDEQMKPYLLILKVKTNKKILGEYKNVDFQLSGLTPHLIFGIALIYMLSADGLIDDHEVEQLQSNISVFPGLYESASTYTKTNSIEQFLWDARSKLSEQKSLFVLINTYDLLLSDGIAEEHEKILFDRFLATFGFNRKQFQPYANLIEIKNQRPTAVVSKLAQPPTPAIKTEDSLAGIKNLANDAHHLREVSIEKSTLNLGATVAKKPEVQVIKTGSKAQEANALVQSDKKQTPLIVPPVTAHSLNIQKAKPESAVKNVQIVESEVAPQNAENTFITSPAKVKESLLEASIQTPTASINSNLGKSTSKDNIQSIEAQADFENTQQISTDSIAKNIQPLSQPKSSKKSTASNIYDNVDHSPNLQPLDSGVKSTVNLQSLEDTTSQSNQQLISPSDGSKNPPHASESSLLGANTQLLPKGNGVTGLDNLSEIQNLDKNNPQALSASADNPVHQGPTVDSNLNSEGSTTVFDPSKDSAISLIADTSLSHGIVEIDGDTPYKDSNFKEPKLSPLQERFAGIYSEIVDVHEKLDLLDGISSNPRQGANQSQISETVDAPSTDTGSLGVLIEEDQSPRPSTHEEESGSLNTNSNNSNIDSRATNPFEMQEELVADSSAASILSKTTHKDASPDDLDPNKLSPKKQSTALISTHFSATQIPSIPSDTQAVTPVQSLEDNLTKISKPPIYLANTQIEVKSADSNHTLPHQDIALQSNLAFKPLEILVTKQSIDSPSMDFHIEPIHKALRKQGLSVFTQPEQIVLPPKSPSGNVSNLTNDLPLFEAQVDNGISIHDVFIPKSITTDFGDDYLRSSKSSKVLIPIQKLVQSHKPFSRTALSFIKISIVVAVVGLCSIEIFAPCPGQICEGRQTGAPLMIEPGPTKFFQNAFAALYARLDYQA